jgi:hypothetical protein
MESGQADQITYCGTSGVMLIAAIPGIAIGALEKASGNGSGAANKRPS